MGQTSPPATGDHRTDDLFERTARWVGDRLAGLAARPGLLLAACFAANAVFLPYHGIYHDARLYAGQVVQAASGRLSDDVFFRYGSQTKFTFLPEFLAVPTRWVGVEPVFFAAYVASTLLRLWATQRLAVRLLGPTPAVAAGLILAAVTPGWWGRFGIFALNEWYFTGRVPAMALSALGLERALDRRWLTAAVLFLAAGVLHPLMAVGPVVVVVGAVVWEWATTPGRRWAVAGAGAAAAVVGGWWAYSTGTMDPVWRGRVLNEGSILDPRTWWISDYVRLVLMAGCVALVARRTTGLTRGVWWGLVLAAAAGLAAGMVGTLTGDVLLIQLQPIRLVWPLELVRLPLGLTVARWLWDRGAEGRSAAVAGFALLASGADLLRPESGPLFVAAAIVGLAVARWVCRPADGGWLWRGLVIGYLVWTAVWYGVLIPAKLWEQAADGGVGWLTFGEQLNLVDIPFGLAPRLVAVAVLAAAARWAVRGARARVAAAAGVGAAAALAAYAVPRTEWFAARTDYRHADTQFVARYLAADRAANLTVYWPGAPLEVVWLDLRTQSYFSTWQMAGAVFSQATAVEADRRLGLVTPFEVHRIRREFGRHPELSGEELPPTDAGPPTPDQFRALVADPAVDVAVMPYDFGGAAATNGSVWVYDCRALRAAHPRSGPGGD